MIPRVSVIMAARDAAPFVRQAIDSVLGQSFRDLELIVLDDGSTDGTVDVLRSIDDPRVRVVTGPHRGLGKARNELLRRARGEFVAVMDADDVALPHRLERQVRFLDEHPDVGAVGGWVEVFDDAGSHGLDADPEEDADIRRQLRLSGAMFDGTLTARRKVLEEAGGYDERALRADWALALRLARVSRLYNLPEVLIRYRRHPSAMREATPALPRQRDLVRMRLLAARTLGWRPGTVKHVLGPAFRLVGLALRPRSARRRSGVGT